VAFLVDAPGSATAYSVTTDENDVTWINFGDNINGLVPAVNMTIWASYRVIIGAAGNLAAGQVSSIVTPISGVSIGYLADGVTPNSTAMTGGADPESNDSIRANAPTAFQVQDRAVSADDFASLALNVPGVLMSTAIGNHSTSVSLYVLGPNYGPPGPDLVDNILDYFESRQLAGVSLSVVAPDVVLVDVGSSGNNVTLVVADNFAQATVINNVTAALQAFLSPPNVSFGQLLNVSDLYEQVTAVAGVLYCIIPVFTREDTPQTGTASIQFRPTEVPSWGVLYMTTTGGITS
jgi:predicted phage baseplate assembly protein